MRWRAAVTGACFAFAAWAAFAQDFDHARSRIGFELQTRWGQRLQGAFPRYDGAVQVLPDGRHRVQVALQAASVEIVGHPAYTRFSRGDGFFAATRYPWVRFESDPYPVSLLRTGGDLQGVLDMRGVRRRETFHVAPAQCARPAHDCAVEVSGTVQRSDYAMATWGIVLRDQVRFELYVRLAGEAG